MRKYSNYTENIDNIESIVLLYTMQYWYFGEIYACIIVSIKFIIE